MRLRFGTATCACLAGFVLACGEDLGGNDTAGNPDLGTGNGGSMDMGTGNGGSTDMGSGNGGSTDMGSGNGGSTDMGSGNGEIDMGSATCESNADCGGESPFCIVDTCSPMPAGGAIGWGDGSPDSVTFELLHKGVETDHATDLDFNWARPNELWVSHRFEPNNLPCTEFERQGCADLEGSTTTIFDPGTPEQRTEWIQDFNAWHFMRRPPAIAFGDDGFFATCGEARTGNFLDDLRADFIGPTLWTSDPEIYKNWAPGTEPRGWNGSHMDMLHASPWCTGIAHDTGNAYWVVNGQRGTLDWYDFNMDHGPGQADHSDGQIRRYADVQITRVPFMPSHIELYEGRVYVADAGGGRVFAFDPTGATPAGPLSPVYEELAEGRTFTGGTVTEIVGSNRFLLQPAGIAVVDDVIYVSDTKSSQFYAFDLEGNLLNLLDTDFPEDSLGGIAIGPDSLLYFVNMPDNEVYRIVPR